jgi:mannosyl-3-phosphoglycerate phosphatase
MGANDKGVATRILLDSYQRLADQAGRRLVTIAIGDSLNDQPMLALVTNPVLVQRPDGSYDPDVRLPRLLRSPAVGPVGWNQSVLDLLQEYRTPAPGQEK